MPNDAKLGLVIGVGMVVAVAVVFFREDGSRGQLSKALSNNPAFRAAAGARPVTGKMASRSAGQHHTVQEGDTLTSLARRYLGDEEKADSIYRQNQDVIKTPDQLVPGTVLVIPEKPGDSSKTQSSER
jgi:nucleoid-associated protein YgaU